MDRLTDEDVKKLIKNRNEQARKRFVLTLRILHAVQLIAIVGMAVLDVVAWLVTKSSVAYLFLAWSAVELIAFIITVIRAPQFVFVKDKLILNAVFTLGIALAFLNTDLALVYAAVKGILCITMWIALIYGRKNSFSKTAKK